MPQNIPDNLYTGGAVVFDSSPSVNFYAQHMARKQAKDEALDEYYRRLPGTINEAGMRDKERPILTQQVNEAQQFWLKNKDKIRNPKLDNGAAQIEYENRIRQANRLVDESKAEAQKGLEIFKLRHDPQWSHIFDDPDFVKTIEDWEKPIGTPDRKSFDVSTLKLPPKPFAQDKYLDQFGRIKRGKSTALDTIDRGDFTVLETTKSTYDQAGLEAIRTNVVGELKINKSFEKFVKKELDNPEMLKKLNPLYQQYYGKPIESYEDFATAYTLSGLQPEITDTKEKPDTFGRQKQMEAIRQGNRVSLAYLRNSFQQLKEQQKENRLNVIISDQIDESKLSPDGSISVNPTLLKEFSLADEFGDKATPSKVRIVGDRVQMDYPDGKTVNLGLQDYKATMRKVFNQPVTTEDATTPKKVTPQKPSKGKLY